jgi:uncharacterized membrane protein
MSGLLDEIRKEASEADAWSESLEEELKRKRADDQSRLAYWIIRAFLVFVGLLILFVLLSFLTPSDCETVREGDTVTTTCSGEAWKSKAEFLLSVISSVMLPVVTLVLGFYFGTEKGRE